MIDEIAEQAGVEWFDYQRDALVASAALPGPAQRVCLYYKTGAGKSLTALAQLKLWGHGAAVVIAPPSTHPAWVAVGEKIGMKVECMSHAKFRMSNTKLSRYLPVIADEFHMFGGQGKAGFTKLQRFARGLEAPMVLASATPNYNDAERVYCIQSILDPRATKGGYLQFLYANCFTEQNPYGMTPLVSKENPFIHHKDAAEFLASLPQVYYLSDDLVYKIQDIFVPVAPHVDDSFWTYGLNERKRRIIASQIEEKHAVVDHTFVGDNGRVWPHIMRDLIRLISVAEGPVLVFANHSTVATALAMTMHAEGWTDNALVTGATTQGNKAAIIAEFNAGKYDVLVGTASLATGTDGMDKVCDTLIILDDTEDDALRRQLIGRIMPRGTDTDSAKKNVYRLVPL